MDKTEQMKPSDEGLIFLLSEIFGGRAFRPGLNEIELLYQNGRLRSVPWARKDVREIFENIMTEVAAIPADFNGKVFIGMKGGAIIGYHFSDANGDGMDAPRIYRERLNKRQNEEAGARS